MTSNAYLAKLRAPLFIKIIEGSWNQVVVKFKKSNDCSWVDRIDYTWDWHYDGDLGNKARREEKYKIERDLLLKLSKTAEMELLDLTFNSMPFKNLGSKA